MENSVVSSGGEIFIKMEFFFLRENPSLRMRNDEKSDPEHFPPSPFIDALFVLFVEFQRIQRTFYNKPT
jgi:hypothetical protein